MRNSWLGKCCSGLLAVSLITAISSFSSACVRDIYVNNATGDDRNDGSSPELLNPGIGPCRSIGRALKHAHKGDRIILAETGEPYRESITLQGARHSGVEEHPFTIVGNGATLDGSGPVDEEAWEHFRGDIFRFRPSYLSQQQLFLDGKPLSRVTLEAEPTKEDLEPLQWGLYRGHVYFRVEPTRLPQQYSLANSKLRVGIALYRVRHVVIQDLVIQGYVIDGLNAHDSVFESAVVGLTSRGNGRSGVSIGGASKVGLEACLVGSNGRAQIRAEGIASVSIRNCDIIDKSPDAPGFVSKAKAEILVEGERVD